MIRWVVKGIAAFSVIALIIGCAAEFTTLIGDLKSVGSASSFSNTLGIMLAKTSNRRKQEVKCEAYKKGTDFPQRPGAVAHALIYHIITLILLIFLIIQQAFRALLPGSLGTLYRFLPLLSGKMGLIGAGASMLYLGLQTLSYSVGKIHVASAILLLLVALVNIVSGFFSSIVGCAGEDPTFGGGGFGGGMMGGGGDMGMGPDDMYGPPPPGLGGPPPPGMDGGFPGPPGGPEPGMGAPDPYDDGNGPGNGDGVDGVGASAPAPGMIEKSQSGKTFGRPPIGMAPLNGFAQGNSETDPRLLAQGGSSGGTQNVVFDPITGQWNTVIQPPTVPNPLVQPPVAQAPIGYDIYGRAIMAPAPPVISGATGWPGVLPQYPLPVADAAGSSASTEASSQKKEKDPKKIARQEAKREYGRIRAEEEEKEASVAERIERKARQRERERQRLLRREEREATEAARLKAARDAYQNLQVEEAEEDARRRQSREVMQERRQQAIDDARRQAIEREKAYYAVAQDWQRSGGEGQPPVTAPGRDGVADRSQINGEPTEASDRVQKQTLALQAAQQAATAGRPLAQQHPAENQYGRDSFLSGGGVSVAEGPMSLLPLPPMAEARPSSGLSENRGSMAAWRRSAAQMLRRPANSYLSQHARQRSRQSAQSLHRPVEYLAQQRASVNETSGDGALAYPPGATEEERELAHMRMQASAEAKKRYTEFTTARQLQKEHQQDQKNAAGAGTGTAPNDIADPRATMMSTASPEGEVTFDFTALQRPDSVAAKSFSTLKPEDQRY